MVAKKNDQARLRLATIDGNSIEQSRDAPPSALESRGVPEVLGESLDVGDAGILPLQPSDLFDASLWDSGVLRDFGPLPFAFLQLIDDVRMDGFGHIAEDKPVYGVMQPENGGGMSLRFLLMPAGRPRKVSTPKDIIGQILIDNVRARWERAFPNAATDTARLEALSKRSGVGKETLRKVLRGDQSPGIDTVDLIARALGTTADALLRAAPEDEAAA